MPATVGPAWIADEDDQGHQILIKPTPAVMPATPATPTPPPAGASTVPSAVAPKSATSSVTKTNDRTLASAAPAPAKIVPPMKLTAPQVQANIAKRTSQLASSVINKLKAKIISPVKAVQEYEAGRAKIVKEETARLSPTSDHLIGKIITGAENTVKSIINPKPVTITVINPRTGKKEKKQVNATPVGVPGGALANLVQGVLAAPGAYKTAKAERDKLVAAMHGKGSLGFRDDMQLLLSGVVGVPRAAVEEGDRPEPYREPGKMKITWDNVRPLTWTEAKNLGYTRKQYNDYLIAQHEGHSRPQATNAASLSSSDAHEILGNPNRLISMREKRAMGKVSADPAHRGAFPQPRGIANGDAAVAQARSDLRHHGDNGFTLGHSDRVGNVSAGIAAELGLDKSFQQAMKKAGILHDWGKTAIPLDILLKPGKLTDTEYEVMQSHVAETMKLLEAVGVRDEWLLAAAREHHQGWNEYDRGYAAVRVGDDWKTVGAAEHGSLQSFVGGIVHVADAYDAAQADRPYKSGMPPKAAIKQLEKDVGTAFNPEFFDALIRYVARTERNRR